MDLYFIQKDLIADRSSEAWFRIDTPGPFFRYQWTYGTSGSGPFSHIEGEHTHYAVLREEPSLTMSWGLEVHSWEDRQRMSFPWAERFPDPSVRAFWVDFFWNNALIDRVELCHVDGGRGLIPMPHAGQKVTDYELAVAVLVHGLEDGRGGGPVRILEQIGVTRMPDEARRGAGSS